MALASNPTFDPNRFADGTAPDEWLDPHGALNTFDRAFGAYAPGSTFKMITAVAQLEGPDPVRPPERDVLRQRLPRKFGNDERRCNATDQRTGKPVANGNVDLPRALTVSSDVYFYDVGNEFWNDCYNFRLIPSARVARTRTAARRRSAWPAISRRILSGYGIQEAAFQFGFGKATGVGLGGDQAGRIPTRSFNVELNKTSTDETSRTWRRGDGASIAVGQGDVLVTPLQLANVYAAFANGGTLYTPRLASAILASGVGLPEGKLGDVVHALDPQMLRSALLTPEIRDPILQGLIGVVNNGEGTAYYAFRNYSGPTFAGKTGTAQVAGGAKDDTSWFVGFTNAENDPNQPQYVVLSIVEQAGFGSEVSAPIVARVAEYLTGNEPTCRPGRRGAEQEGLMHTDGGDAHEPHAGDPFRRIGSPSALKERSRLDASPLRHFDFLLCSRSSPSARSASR